MSQALQPHSDDGLLVRYLLGALPESEAERLDEASIADDDFAARLRAAEQDLIDAYARRSLPRDTALRFEWQYLSSPARRRRVRAAELFLEAIDRAAAPAAADRNALSWRRRGWVPAAAAAAILLVAAVLSVAMWRARPQPNASASAGESRSIPERGTAVLVRRQDRAVAHLPAIAPPLDGRPVAFELHVDASAALDYRITLKDAASQRALWRSELLRARTAGDGSTIRVVIPPGLLAPQRYWLEISSGQERVDPIGTYVLQVMEP